MLGVKESQVQAVVDAELVKRFGCGYFSTTVKYCETKHLAPVPLFNGHLKGGLCGYPGVLLASSGQIQPA